MANTTWNLLLFILIASMFTQQSRAEMPLFAGVEEAKSVGPKTEAVDLSPYRRVIYVSADAPKEAADGTKEHPFSTVASALDSVPAASATERHAILVAGGTYPAANLRMKAFVDLFGGFDKDWMRDIFTHPTILDAAKSGPVVFGADNSTLDGFVLTNGLHKRAGGAIVCDHVSPVISNNVIRNNATVEPDDFRRDMIHQKGSDGGAIALLAGSNALVRNNLICQNTTGIGNGGGIFVWNESKPRIVANVIIDNHTGLSGKAGKEGSRSSNGGAIAVSLSCQPEITANVIAMNTVADNSDAGGVYLEYDAHAKLKANWIVGNFGMDDGGGMYVMKLSQPLVERNVFAGNRNTSGGSSQIRLSKEGRMTAINNLFISPASAMDVVHSWLILRNNTFICTDGIAMVWENEAPHFASPQITHNILVGQTKPQIFVKPGPVTPHIAHNVAPGGLAGDQNIDVDPRFIDDSIKGAISDRHFDPARFQTVLTVSDVPLKAGDLSGRILNVGSQWTVVQSNDAKQLTAWGNLSDNAADFLIPGTYRLADDSPCRAQGAYAPPK